jgi:SAM-dependent methyltransferase
MNCPVCLRGPTAWYRSVDAIAFFRCVPCGSLFADPAFIARVENGDVANYRDSYWDHEITAAQERNAGGSLARVAETMRLCRVPIKRFIDIGAGSGGLLDCLAELLPEIAGRFYGIELFPPAPELRSKHPNYRLGTLDTLTETFEAGVCIEVIEHLSASTLRGMAAQLARHAAPGALFLFNSAQPSFVQEQDPAYLDPLRRGHIVSYSVAGAAAIFAPAGFHILPFPGRDWAFLAEFCATPPRSGLDAMFDRLWHPRQENLALLASARYGQMMIAMGLDSARAALEAATVQERTEWALCLQAQLETALRKTAA